MIIKSQPILQIDRARKRRDPTTSVATPAIAGGLFAVDRKWFQKIGWWGTFIAPKRMQVLQFVVVLVKTDVTVTIIMITIVSGKGGSQKIKMEI